MGHQFGVGRQVLQAGLLLGGYYQDIAQFVGLVSQIDKVHVGEFGLERAGQYLYQAPVGFGPPRIHGDHAVLGQVLAGLAKEFPRGQMEGDIRRTVGVEGNDVVFAGASGQKVAPILGHGVQVGLVHVKVLAAHADDLRVYLGAVNGDGAIDGGVLLGHGARRRADEGQAAYLVGGIGRVVKVGCDQKVIPDAVNQH